MTYSARDINAQLSADLGIIQTAVTSGAEAEASGLIHRREVDLTEKFDGVMAVISGRATLASGVTLSFLANFQDSPNGSSWTDMPADAYGHGTATGLAVTVVRDAAGGALAAQKFAITLGCDLSKADEYIRLQATPDFSSGSTDTCLYQATLVFGGAAQTPAPSIAKTTGTDTT